MTAVIALVSGLLLILTPALGRSAPAGAGAPVMAGPASTSWTQFHFDDGHTGFDSTQPQMTSASTGWTSATMDDEVFGSPLIFNGLVYAATLNNTVYAFNQTTGATVWSNHLGSPETGGWTCGNVSPQGIMGTPVIDTAGGRIYVAALFNDATEGTDVYRVIGLDLATGNKSFDTAMSIPNFDWRIQQERGALSLHNGFVYVPMGGRFGDCGNYHGYVIGVPIAGGTQPAYQTPDSGSGIWASGGVVVDDATGNVFAATGNGSCSVPHQNDAVVRLNPTTLALADYFMPADWQNTWCGPDLDLGGSGPLLISPSLLFQSGKAGGGFLLNPNNLGQIGGQLYPAQSPYVQADVCLGNGNDATFGAFAYAAPFVYVPCQGHGIVALNVNTGTPSFTPCSTSCGAPDWQAGGTVTFGPPIVAAGAVWAADYGGSGGLYAFNQTTGAQLFHASGFSVNHFVSVSEASGQVFVPAHTQIREFNTTTGVTFSPTQLDFNGQAPTTTSAAHTVTLTNNQGTTLTVTSATVSGVNASMYTKGTDTCSGMTIAASGGTCTVQVTFHPPSFGGFPASLTFVDSASSSPQGVPLNGDGAIDNQAHLYTLDRFGGLHADGTAPAMASGAYFGWNIDRGAALFPDGMGGYTLDGYGGLHAFGNAPPAAAPAYWGGWDIARGVALAPWSSSATAAGWTLDGYGGIHAFGGATTITGYSYFGFDIARGLVILPDSTPGAVAGYTLDGYGGIHPFGGATPVPTASYWPGWDIAHSITVSPNASKLNPAGWTLDGFGGVHPFGTAPAQAASGYWPGWDVARAIVAWTGSGTGGWVMDSYGGLHPFGSAPTVSPFPYWGWSAAATIAGPGFSAGARKT